MFKDGNSASILSIALSIVFLLKAAASVSVIGIITELYLLQSGFMLHHCKRWIEKEPPAIDGPLRPGPGRIDTAVL